MSSPMLSRPYDVEIRHQSTICSSISRFTTYSGSEVMDSGSWGL